MLPARKIYTLFKWNSNKSTQVWNGKIVKIPIFLPKLNNKGILPFFADVVKRKTIETEPRYYLLKFRRRHAVTLYVSVVIKNVFKKIPKVPIRLYQAHRFSWVIISWVIIFLGLAYTLVKGKARADEFRLFKVHLEKFSTDNREMELIRMEKPSLLGWLWPILITIFQ